MLMVNNLVGFGAGGESLIVSTPTTWNPSDKGTGVSLSGGNLSYALTSAANNCLVRSIYAGPDASKWYWEITITASTGASTFTVGIANALKSVNVESMDAGADAWGYQSNGSSAHSGTAAYGSSYTSGDIIMVAMDLDNNKVWFGKNGVWQASGDPAAGTNAAYTDVTGSIYAALAANAVGWTATANFGATAFSYTPPAGFKQGLGA